MHVLQVNCKILTLVLSTVLFFIALAAVKTSSGLTGEPSSQNDNVRL